MEEMMKNAKLKSANLDDELDDMIANDPELKGLANGKNDNSKFFMLVDLDELENNNSEDELEKLENELAGNVNGKAKAKAKGKTNKEIDELKMLEDELDDDNKDIKPEVKVDKLSNVKEIQNEKKPDIESKQEVIKKETQVTDDKFPPYAEIAFHKQEKMSSMGVIEKEKEIMDEAIEYKKSRNEDHKPFEKKKMFLEVLTGKIQDLVEDGKMTIDQYKVTVKNQLNYEMSIVKFLENDFLKDEKNSKLLSKQAYEFSCERLKQRIKILEEELTEEIEQEDDENNTIQNDEPSTVEKKNEIKEIKIESTVEKTEPQKIEIKINEKLQKIVKNKLFDYKNAYYYFINNNLSLRAEEAAKKLSYLFSENKKIENGEDINEFELPIDITPDFICGYSSDERFIKYRDLIKEISNKKTSLSDSLNELISKFNNYSKKEIEKHEAAIKKVLTEKKNQIEIYTKLIRKLVEDQKNPWIPCPIGQTIYEVEKVEVTNPDVVKDQIKIYFGKNTYLKKDYYLYVTLQASDKKVFNEYVYAETDDCYNKTLTFNLDPSDFKNIHRKNLEISVYKPRFLISAKLKTKFTIKLADLKSKCTIENNYVAQIESKRFEPTYFVSIKIKNSLVEKEYKTIEKPVFNITKTYQMYDKNKDYSEIKVDNSNKNIKLEEINSITNNEINISKEQPKPQEPKKPNTKVVNEPSKELKNDKNDKNEQKIDPSQFSKIELTDPDDVECLNSVSVLESRLKYIEAQIANIDGRPPNDIRQKKLKISVKLKMLKDQIQSGTLTLDSYMKMLVNQYQRDLKLFMYFKQIDKKDSSILIEQRLQLMKKEIDEGKEMLNK